MRMVELGQSRGVKGEIVNEGLEISGRAKVSYIKLNYSVSALRGSFNWPGFEIAGFSRETVVDNEALAV